MFQASSLAKFSTSVEVILGVGQVRFYSGYEEVALRFFSFQFYINKALFRLNSIPISLYVRCTFCSPEYRFSQVLLVQINLWVQILLRSGRLFSLGTASTAQTYLVDKTKMLYRVMSEQVNQLNALFFHKDMEY